MSDRLTPYPSTDNDPTYLLIVLIDRGYEQRSQYGISSIPFSPQPDQIPIRHSFVLIILKYIQIRNKHTSVLGFCVHRNSYSCLFVCRKRVDSAAGGGGGGL